MQYSGSACTGVANQISSLPTLKLTRYRRFSAAKHGRLAKICAGKYSSNLDLRPRYHGTQKLRLRSATHITSVRHRTHHVQKSRHRPVSCRYHCLLHCSTCWDHDDHPCHRHSTKCPTARADCCTFHVGCCPSIGICVPTRPNLGVRIVQRRMVPMQTTMPVILLPHLNSACGYQTWSEWASEIVKSIAS